MLKTLVMNTLLKEYRNKAFLTLFFLTIILTFLFDATLRFIFSEVIDQSLTAMIGNQAVNIFFFGINIWAGIIACLLGTGLIKTDLENDTISQLLSFPIPRYKYLLARVIGGWGIVMIYYLSSFIIGLTLFSISSKGLVIGGGMILAMLSVSIHLLCVVTLSMIASQFFSKLIAFLLVMINLLFISLANGTLGSQSFSELFSDITLVKGIGVIYHMIFPRLGTLNEITSGLILSGETPGLTATFITHFLVSSIGLLLFGTYLFKRKEF